MTLTDLPGELLTIDEMARADRMAAHAGVNLQTLMRRAGEEVADVVRATPRPDGPVLVICGPGNNGGDGYVAAQTLRAAGVAVRVARFGPPPGGAAASAAAAWGHEVETAQVIGKAGLVVDALFGAGLSRPLDAAASALVEAVNGCGKPVVAIDVPSGLDGDGAVPKGPVVRATRTVTFFRLKIGHVLAPGRAVCGTIDLVDIGIPGDVLAGIAPSAFINAPALWRAVFVGPRVAGHKYSRGHAVVVSGGLSHTGAARLAARAALRAGAGLVTLASPGSALAVNAAHLTAIMLARSEGPEGLAALLSDARHNAVVLGPALGVGEATRALVATALAQGPAVVLDADALTSHAGAAEVLASGIRASAGAVVLTPHEGEFARLFAGHPDVLEAATKVARARAAARLLGGVVLLKGADTVVAAPDGRASVSVLEAPWLATAGSGDVLSGIVGGLLAQGLPPFEAASCAAYLHASAARAFGPGLIAEDLPDLLPTALRPLFEDDRS